MKIIIGTPEGDAYEIGELEGRLAGIEAGIRDLESTARFLEKRIAQRRKELNKKLNKRT